jgi:hypothetical protein
LARKRTQSDQTALGTRVCQFFREQRRLNRQAAKVAKKSELNVESFEKNAAFDVYRSRPNLDNF